MRPFPKRLPKLTVPSAILAAGLVLCPISANARAADSKPLPTTCTDQIPTGVKVTRVPEAEQHKVTISDFNVTPSKDPQTYDLAMQVKNGTDNWCITSLGVTYVLGDARGQEWTANEYPAVVEFKAPPETPKPGSAHKAKTGANLPAHSIGMAPGDDEKRLLSDLYSYIQPRPTGYFDGFHLISAEIKYCMGYMLGTGK
jgi:hypothetical protein